MRDEDLTIDGVSLLAELLADRAAPASGSGSDEDDLTIDGPSLLEVLGAPVARWAPPPRLSSDTGVTIHRGLDRWRGLPALVVVVSLLVGFLLVLAANSMNQTAGSPTGTTVLSPGEP